jgi:thiol-disulfide isomerase/thioredoxin
VNRTGLLVAGLAVLGLSVAGMVRELGKAREETRGDWTPGVAAGRKLPELVRVEAQRPVPPLRFIDGEAKPHALADFRGRVILLNLWATWCPPCRKEMPNLDRLQEKLGGPDFEVVALSIDRGGLFVVKSFYDEMDIRNLKIYLDANAEAMAALGAVGLPTTLLVDRKGWELWRIVGPVEWDDPEVVERIRRYLKDGVRKSALPAD